MARPTIKVPTEDLRAIFDLAVNSMNFGSGFWDKEDTDIARRIAGHLGIDPAEATPDNARGYYPHHFAEGLSLGPDGGWGLHGLCRLCSKLREAEIHHG